jgi:hypothetical protein
MLPEYEKKHQTTIVLVLLNIMSEDSNKHDCICRLRKTRNLYQFHTATRLLTPKPLTLFSIYNL